MSNLPERLELRVTQTFAGTSLPPEEHATLRLERTDELLRLEWLAPYHEDPRPAAPPGSTWGLWAHEVLELFLVGPGESYVEIELGPHGHYLVLELRGVRNVVRRDQELSYSTQIRDDRWLGHAELPLDSIPFDVQRLNAFRIHGVSPNRAYSAAFPLPTARPDFHAIHLFPTLEEVLAGRQPLSKP
jgi:hypothetical protein